MSYVSLGALSDAHEGEISGTTGELGRGKLISGCRTAGSYEFMSGETTHNG